jgi:hypothetical protein
LRILIENNTHISNKGELTLPNIFGKGKRREKTVAESVGAVTPLQQLCADDNETYNALFPVMLLDPRKVDASVKEAADEAKKSEKRKDFASARMWYEVAGGLAIFEGNVKEVVEYYGAAERVTGEDYLVLKDPEKAVAKAQEYYKRYLRA